jgi:predicted HicB family RNase H-like nuclease
MSANVMTYMGYSARVEFDADDAIFLGRIAGINDIVGFHADNVEGLVAAFREAVDDYVASCAKVGKIPERSASGKLMLRVDPKIHAASLRAAELAGLSLNQWSERALAEAATSFGR